MSQPALTNFFSQSKRATRSSKAAKVGDLPQVTVENDAPSKRATRKQNNKVEKVIVPEKVQPKPEEETPILKEVSTNKDVLKNVSSEVNANVEAVKEDAKSESKTAPKRGRKKVIREVEESQPEECPSPAKRNKRLSRKKTTSETVEEAVEISRKLTPEEVKKQLKGTKKLTDLKEKLKKIEQTSESLKEKEAKTIAKAKKAAEDKAKKDARTDYEKSPAYLTYHSLSVKDDGTLPLPFSYKFLEEVFRCTEQISTMLHNRKETITFDKLKAAVQQMLRKNFNVSYLKQIKTVFPEAYRYAWENIIGRYGKKLAEFELTVTINTKYKEEMIRRLGGKEAPEEDRVPAVEKIGPQAMVERKSLFKNSLIQLVKLQHKTFCSQLNPPISVDEKSMVRFHKDFQVDRCPPVEEAELPQKPEVEVVTTAAQILEKSRALFEINPRLSGSLATVAEKKEAEVPVSTPPPAAAVRKDLQGLPQKLIDKILAKEAEKAAKDMFTDKSKEDKVRRLRRLPEIARLVKSVFITERKFAVLTPIVEKKVVASYPGSMSAVNLKTDLKYLVEVSPGFLSFVTVQGKEYLKLNPAADINKVVGEIEKMLENAKN